MGCDIHEYVEKRVDGVWTLVAPKLVEDREDMEHLPHGLVSRYPGKIVDTHAEVLAELGSYEERRESPFHIGRNYDLFAMLAGVRNGRGFAGCKTGEGFVPIAEPKGVPEDASPGYAWEAERWDCDGHSHSWLTVAELLAYDWDQRTERSGVIGSAQFARFLRDRKPSSWSGDVWGRNIRHVSNEEMAAAAKGVSPATDGEYENNADGLVTRVNWGVTYRECAGEFLTKTLPALQALGAPDDVRLCFFFDN